MSKNLPKYPEGTEECIHCLGDGRYNNGILIQNCPQCGGKRYRNLPKKHTTKEPASQNCEVGYNDSLKRRIKLLEKTFAHYHVDTE